MLYNIETDGAVCPITGIEIVVIGVVVFVWVSFRSARIAALLAVWVVVAAQP